MKWSVSAVKRLYVHRWSQDWDVWSTWDQVIHYFWSYAKLVLSLFKLTRIHTRCFHFMISPRSRHVGQMTEMGNIPTFTTTAHSQHNTVFIEFGFKITMNDGLWLAFQSWLQLGKNNIYKSESHNFSTTGMTRTQHEGWVGAHRLWLHGNESHPPLCGTWKGGRGSARPHLHLQLKPVPLFWLTK